MRFSSLTDQLADLGTARWATHHRAVQRLRAGEDIVMLSIGEPIVDTPPAIVEAASAAMRSGRTKYALGGGEPELRRVLAERYSKRSGRRVEPEQVTFFPGSHTALYALSRTLVESGDAMMIPEPYYAAYDGIVRASGAEIVPVPLRPDYGFHLQLADLEAAVTPACRAILLNNPNNPTGAVLEPETVAAVADFARRNDLWLISDEAYEHHVYEGRFVSPFDLDGYADGVAVISSVSKSHAMTGWRCGWAVGSPELVNRLISVSEAMMFGAQPFLQDATVFALSHEFPELDEMISSYRRRAERAVEVLAASPHLAVRTPEAGIFIMADVRPTGLSGTAFANRLLEEYDTAVMPGEAFGPSASGHVRISLTAHDDVLAEGCRRIARLASEIAGG